LGFPAIAFSVAAMIAASPAYAQKLDQPNPPPIYQKPTVVNGLVKVCKAAKQARLVGAMFEFSDTQGINKFVMPAGPMPGGYCIFGRVPYPVGSKVTIVETPTLGVKTTDIVVAPAARLVEKDVEHNSVTFIPGTGVIEITFYQIQIEFGPLEVCKLGDGISGNAIFSIDGMPGTFNVPVGACSPGLFVPSGEIVIREVQPPPGAEWSDGGCQTVPADRQGTCDNTAHTSTVQIVGGDISVQTIAIIRNKPAGSPPPPGPPPPPIEQPR
jgi:hypothetical protein